MGYTTDFRAALQEAARRQSELVAKAMSAPDPVRWRNQLPHLALSAADALNAAREAHRTLLGKVVPKPYGVDWAKHQVQDALAKYQRSLSAGIWAKGLQHPLLSFHAAVAPVLQLMAEGGVCPEEVEKSGFPFGWAGMLPAEVVIEMYRLWANGDVGGSREVLVEAVGREELADDILSSCRGLEVAVPNPRLVEDALWAHREGRFSLSVPVLMAQTEGLVRRTAVALELMRDLSGSTPGRPYTRVGRVLALVEGELARQFRAGIHSSAAAPFRPFLDYLRRAQFGTHRNPIMHGTECWYGTPELSATCIAALYEALDLAQSALSPVGLSAGAPRGVCAEGA
jgi:hypothetical protein